MTDKDSRLERLQAAADTVAESLTEALAEQGKKAGANMLMLYGSKSVLDAGGFLFAVQNATEAALLYLLEEEYVTLNEKGLATPEKQAERRAKRAEADAAHAADPNTPFDPHRRGDIPGAYL